MKTDISFSVGDLRVVNGYERLNTFTHITIEDDFPAIMLMTGDNRGTLERMKRTTLEKFHRVLGLQLASPLKETIVD